MVALLVAAPLVVLGAVGMYDGFAGYPVRADLVHGLLQGGLIGAALGVAAMRVRSRWPGLEPLTDVERLSAVHAVHFGEDVGNERAAGPTFEFAAWQRSEIERKQPDRLLSACAVMSGLMLGRVLWSSQHGSWLGVLGALLLGAAFGYVGLAGDARRKALRDNLWFAEWYAAQRLQRTDAG
jgi:hypothetical protein